MKLQAYTFFFIVAVIPSMAAPKPALHSNNTINVKPVVEDSLRGDAQVRLEGYLAQRMESSIQHRILAHDEPRLIEPFKHRIEESCWQTEFWGKWLTSAILACRYSAEPALKTVLDKTVSDLSATQTSDGYIGN